MADIVISDLPVITGVTGDDFVIVNDANATTSTVSFANLLASINQIGIVGFADGSAATPSITFSADVNTGIYRSGPDEWAVSTNANQRLVINAGGNVGIGNPSPGNWNNGANNLVVGSTNTGDNGITIASSPIDVGDITWSDGTNGTELAEGRIRYDHNDNHMAFYTSNTEALRINNNQELLIGTAVPVIGSKIVVDGGNISVPAGVAGNPSLNFATDTDTGVWSAADDHVSVATGGIERATIDDEGHFYLNGDVDTYFYHSADNQLTLVNQNVETLTVDANNNVRLGGATPTIYTNNNEMRMSVDADASGPSSLLSIYLAGGEIGRFTTTGFALGTITTAGVQTIGGGVTVGYPSLSFTRNTDATTTSAISFVGNAAIRGQTGLAHVLNDTGTFTWSIGGTNNALGTAGSTQYMSLNTTTLTVNADISTNSNITLTGASAAGTFLSTPVANTLAISTNGSERFRVGDGGAIGLGGANYGSAGQVLSSNGAGAQPTWVSLAASLPDISTLDPLP